MFCTPSRAEQHERLRDPTTIRLNKKNGISEESHSEEKGRLQLYRINSDGTSRHKLTDGENACLMPAWSPDGAKLVYVSQSEQGMSLWHSNPNGKNAKQLSDPGGHLIPSWLPDSKPIVWMQSQPGNDPTQNSQLWLMNTETLESRPLFSDPRSKHACDRRAARLAQSRCGDNRVPFIISVPWLEAMHGRGTTKITELVDLYPTLADLAEVPAPSTLQGISMKPLLADTESSAWKKEQAFTISRSGGESLRTNDWRFTQWGFGEQGMELYDLKKDPGEFTNQAQNPQYASVVEKLQKQLIAKRNEAGFDNLSSLGSKLPTKNGGN